MSDAAKDSPVENPTLTPPNPAEAGAAATPKSPQTGLLQGKKQLKLGKKKSGRKKKKVIIGVSVVAALVIIGIIVALLLGGGKPKYDPTAIYSGDISVVSRDDVTKTVSMTGTLKSSKTITLYSALTSKVLSLDVKAGDRVNQGQLLAQLYTEEAKEELASQQEQLNQSRVSEQNSIAEAAENYQNAKTALEQGRNQEILGAQKALRDAKREAEKAQKAYDEIKKGRAGRTLQALLDQESALRAAYQDAQNAKIEAKRAGLAEQEAQQELSTAELVRRTALNQLSAAEARLQDLKDHPDPSTPKDERDAAIAELQQEIAQSKAEAKGASDAVDAAEDAKKAASENYTAAQKAIDEKNNGLGLARRQYVATLRQIDAEVAEAGEAVLHAKDAVTDATVALEEAKIHAQQELNGFLRALQAAQASAGSGQAEGQTAIKKLRADINSATVTAPISGIVTAVSAKVGAPAEGPIAVVEDDKNLVVETQIKENAVAKLGIGNEVTFTTPATGDKEYTGVVAFISPSAAVDAPSNDPNPKPHGGDSSSSVMFPVQVTVTGNTEGLRLGSTVKLKAITAGQKNVLAVPKGAIYDAVEVDPGVDPGANPENGSTPDSAGEMPPDTATEAMVDPEADNWPKAILAVDDADSEHPKLREVQVEVLVEGNGMVAIKGADVKEGMTILDNASNYLGLIGQTGHFVDEPPMMEESFE